MKAPRRVRRNTSAQLPLTPAYPDLQASPADWEREAKRLRKHTMERQLINSSKRINALCSVLRQMDATIQDLQKRLRFVEHATKMTAGPR